MEANGDEENRSLYVGNLDPSCTEELIHSIFNGVAPVSRCKIINSASGKDPYCFVEFYTNSDAAKALYRMDRRIIMGKVELLDSYGVVYALINHGIRCMMINGASGKLVVTTKKISCLLELHQYSTYIVLTPLIKWMWPFGPPLLGEQSIRVNWATNNQGMKRGDTNNHHHIFVGDLAEDIDDATLRKAFQPFGEISEVRVVKDAANKNKSKGFGFVAFLKKEDAAKAINEMNAAEIKGKIIRTNWASRKNHPIQSKPLNWDDVFHKSSQMNTTIYVGNLPPDIKDHDLQQLFSQYGTIVETKLFADKGYAFIKFSAHGEATSAIVGTHNQTTIGDPNNPYLLRCSWGKETPDMMNFQQAAAWQHQYYTPFYYQQTQQQQQQQMQPQQQQQPQQTYVHYPQYAMYYQHGATYPTGQQGMAMYPVQNYTAQMSTSPSSGIQTPNQSPQMIGMQASGMLTPQGAPTPSYAMQPAAGYHAQ